MENLPQRPLTPQEKKQYLLNKYVKRDYKITDLVPKYALYFNPCIEQVKDWALICICDDLIQCKKEILWRRAYTEHGDTEVVIDNDSRFSTWHNELLNVDQNGNPYEPGEELMKIDYNSPGNMIQVIANSTPAQQNSTGFRGIGYYASQEIPDYHGTYKIEEIYQI